MKRFSFIQRSYVLVLMVVMSMAMHLSLGYVVVREQFIVLLSVQAVLFILMFGLYFGLRFRMGTILWIALLLRLSWLGALPELSQDYFRFIWDGRLIIQGINPYLYSAVELMGLKPNAIENAQFLIDGMGALNAGHFSNYPPLNQLCFAVATYFGGSSIMGTVIVMRMLIIAADIGTIWVGTRLLQALQMHPKHILFYAINPFVIIEFTGNLHFEAVMVFFLVLALYALHRKNYTVSALAMGLSIATKLLPLMLLPLLIRWLGRKRVLRYYLWVGLINLVLFAPFLSTRFWANYSNTLALWFQKFEFNASIYYILRYFGFFVRGYNEIAVIGKIGAVLTIITVALLSFKGVRDDLPSLIKRMLLVLTVYLFTATTVHPWYLAIPLFLSVFTPHRYPLVWSFTIVLSYQAYSNVDFRENPWILLLEYLVVYGVFVWEIRRYGIGATPLIDEN